MASVFPFRALRPRLAQAGAVAAVPYDVVNRREACALAEGRPLSFLHVSRAEIDLPPDTDPYSDVVYRTAAGNFARLRSAAPLIQDDAPSLYLYRLTMGSHEQTGIAGCFSLAEYEDRTIARHEKTRKDKEDDRTRHILELSAQSGPVFLTFPASAAVDALTRKVTSEQPIIDFTADDGIRHTIWRVSDDARSALVDAFAVMPRLYIADGHHRAASALRARDALRERGSVSRDAESLLAVAFPHNQTQLLPYHRVVKDLDGHTPATLLQALRERSHVVPGSDVPAGRGRVSMYLDGRWYQFTLAEPSPTADAADRLDVSLLHEQVLRPLLKVGDPRSDQRMDFVGGIRGSQELVRLVEEGTAAVAFAMHPVAVTELMTIADAGGIMPPKSTWFEPKLRDGLLIHVI